MTQQPAGVGRAFFPEPDTSPNGSAGRARTRRQAAVPSPPGLRRRRRPAMIALAVAMAGTGAMASAALYQRADHAVPVLMVAAPVAAGARITVGDLSTASVHVPAGVRVIPASELRLAAGEIAAVTLRPGTLLAPADLTVLQPPAPGQQLIPVAVKPSLLPASGLSPGDHVLVVATPGDQGAAGPSAGGPSIAAPVPAVVAAVNAVTDPDGLDVVDLLVAASSGPAVAQQASTGQFALIVTKRSS